MRRTKTAIGLGTTALLGLLPAEAAAIGLARGPYLQAPTPTEVTVVFDLTEPSPAEVRFGREAAGEQVVASPSSAVHHEVRLTGLAPDTPYVYGVEVAGGLEDYQEYALRSGVEEGAGLSFIAMGDTRSDHDAHAAVVAAMQVEAARLLLNTGDLVADGSESEQWDTFFAIETPLLSRVPLLPVVGNHDDDGAGAGAFRDAFVLPDDVVYYSFDYGNAHFIVLDGHVSTEIVCEQDGQFLTECFDAAQLAWLEADLQATCERATAPWVFVAIHAGPFSSEPDRTGNAQLRALLPLLSSHGVTAIFSGHDHYYERGSSPEGITYVITGGGGAPLYDIAEPCPFPHTVATNAAEYHYAVLELGEEAIQLTAKRLDGTVLDEAALTGPRGCRPPETPMPAAAPEDSSCGCRLAPTEGPWRALPALAILGCLGAVRRGRRSRSTAHSASGVSVKAPLQSRPQLTAL